MSISIVKQFSIFLPNKPGQISKFLKIILDNEINIIGIASDIGCEMGVIRVAVAHDNNISEVLTKNGYTVIETPMLSMSLVDKKGQLYNLTKFLAKHKVNITAIYGTSTDGRDSRLLFTVDNMTLARELLKNYEGL